MSDNAIEKQMENIVIFGAGAAGLAAYKKLKQSFNVIAFADNKLFGGEAFGHKIVHPNTLATLVFEQVYIASEYFEQIQRQLVGELGIAQERIQVLPASMIKPLSFNDSREVEKLAEQVLLTVCQAFATNQLRYHVDAGTLLGIYRDDALIPWDDDLDIAIASEDIEQTNELLQQVVVELNDLTRADWVCNKHYAQCSFGAVKKGDLRSFKLRCNNDELSAPMLDVFVKYISGDKMDYVIASRGLTMPSKHLTSPLIPHEFRGQGVYLPFEPEVYLELHYGDWRTPIRDWDLGMLKNATVFE